MFREDEENSLAEQIEERKEKIAMYIKSENYIPLKRKELMILLDVPHSDREMFEYIIDTLIREGRAIETKKGKIMAPESLNIVTGTFTSHSKGFGFVVTDNADEKDIFIPADATHGAMHKDKVMCKITVMPFNKKRAEGEIIKVIERGSNNIVGVFEQGKGFGFVVPDDKRFAKDIFISKGNTKGAVTGHKVVVKITNVPDDRRNPEGVVTEILGHVNDPGVDILSVIKEYDLPLDFPKEVKEELETIESEVSDDELEGREDFRDVMMVTIDGEDAKDLDDAVSLEMLENGNFLLGVHIADVTHYVRENSYLDKEAYKRGTSVYLVDRVIPMIPHKLSNGICSLNPQVDRLTLSCVMEIDHKGDVIDHRIVKSVIKTNERMTYTDVNKILTENDEELIEKYKDLVEMFRQMDKLRQILGNRRKKRGSVNFDIPEAKIILDENGKPIDIKPYESNAATNLIEEFMLISNETVAEEYFWQELPFVYRNHEIPDEEKIRKMADFIGNFGYRIKGKSDLHPKSIQAVLEQAKGKDDEHIISRIILRSMKQAKYMSENYGHFGLAAKYYCHFTSPIRRYPDLQIHRIIKENIEGKMSEKRIRKLRKMMPEVAKQCSVRERTATEAERDTDKLKMVEFMMDKIGETFDGIISGTTNWGIFVELPNTVEGMVSISNLDDDYYVFDDERMKFIGERTGKTYQLGDRVKVQVVRASKEDKTIDFIFVDDEEIEA